MYLDFLKAIQENTQSNKEMIHELKYISRSFGDAKYRLDDAIESLHRTTDSLIDVIKKYSAANKVE